MTGPKEDLRQLLQNALNEAEWGWLKPHVERDAVIVVSREIGLLEAAVRVAENDSKIVDEWINQKLLAKPTFDQIAMWNAQPSKPFLSVIVQPFVLIQEITAH